MPGLLKQARVPQRVHRQVASRASRSTGRKQRPRSRTKRKPRTRPRLKRGQATVGSAITRDGPTTRGFDHFFGFHHARMMKSRVRERPRHATRRTGGHAPASRASGRVTTSPSGRRSASRSSCTCRSARRTRRSSRPRSGRAGAGSAPTATSSWKPTGPSVQSSRPWTRPVSPTTRSSSSPATTAARPPPSTTSPEKQGHFASAQFRGYKADIWDGGHRVPFLVRWPGEVNPAHKATDSICLTDLLATCADVARREGAGQRRRGQRQLPAGTCSARRYRPPARRSCITASAASSRSAKGIGS